MPKLILVEQYHVSVYVPRDLPAAEDDAVRQTLDDPHFHAQLRRAVRGIVRRHAPLRKAKVTVTR